MSSGVITYNDLGGVYLGTIKGQEIIPQLLQDREYWRKEINELIK